ncbi:MAG: CoA transferase, partial [Pseudomonadales bacterium]
FAPVLSIFEAPDHPHNKARGTFVTVDGMVQPAPSPRFSRTAPAIAHGAHAPGQDSEQVLRNCGFGADEIASLRASGVIPA